MARPESIADIEIDLIEFATVEVNSINVDGGLLKAYGTFMELVQKSGGIVEATNYGRVQFKRTPTLQEQCKQLESAQATWDTAKGYYEKMARHETLGYSHQESQAEKWAKGEGLAWPPEPIEPIEAFDVVIRDIDTLEASA